MARLDLDWEYLSLSLSLARLLDELAFLGLAALLEALSLFFANRVSPDFLLLAASPLVWFLAVPMRAALVFLASLGLEARDGVPNREACTTGAAPALTGVLWAGFSCLA